MPAGLQCWDANNNLIIDIDTNIAKYLGTLQIGTSYTGSAQSGSITVPQFGQYSNTPYFFRIDGVISTMDYEAVITISGNQINWQYPRASAPVNPNGGWYNRPNQTLIYGLL